MKITYRVSEADFMDAQRLFVAHEPWYRRRSRQILPWLGAFTILMQVFYLVKMPDDNPALATVMILVGLYMLYCGLAIKWFFRRLYRKDRRYKQDFTADVGEEGIHLVTPDVDSQVKWTSFIRVLESDRIFMLFHAQWIFNVIPKNAFGPSEMMEFRELAHRKIAVHG